MLELLEKAALTALGAASLTQKKGEEMVQELKARYKMSEEEGRAFLDRIQDIARAGRERTSEIAETEVKRVMERMGMVSREDFDRLERRVRALEAVSAFQGEEEEPGTEC
jgi:polyhydroxyalkanoate synthesis regulator phasin